MTKEHYNALMDGEAELTAAEVSEGWHWCMEFDGLLVGPGMSELRACFCWHGSHPVYSTRPPEEAQDDTTVF
jgi:hypothetical protein